MYERLPSYPVEIFIFLYRTNIVSCILSLMFYVHYIPIYLTFYGIYNVAYVKTHSPPPPHTHTHKQSHTTITSFRNISVFNTASFIQNGLYSGNMIGHDLFCLQPYTWLWWCVSVESASLFRWQYWTVTTCILFEKSRVGLKDCRPAFLVSSCVNLNRVEMMSLPILTAKTDTSTRVVQRIRRQISTPKVQLRRTNRLRKRMPCHISM